MKSIILDFDNTMGVQGCDVDDGLALLYLLGNPELAQVEAVCTTYGNNTIDTVHANTQRLFAEWGVDIPVHRGAAGPGADASACDAARYLAQAVAERPGELHVLATGSTTNLKGAVQLNPQFFQQVASVTLMGGIERSLVINGRIMDELNLSCDPDATLGILQAAAEGTPVSIATAQNCLPAFFTRQDFISRFGASGWLTRAIDYWFSDMDQRYEWRGFTVWDVVAAGILIKPELFTPLTRNVTLDRRLLSVGLLEEAVPDAPQAAIATPRIANQSAFVQDALASWERALNALPAAL